ncbi:MAG: COX15/CtaA family protein [Microthrixaceae bacterium]
MSDGWRIDLRTYRRVVVVALFLLCAIVVTGAAVRLTGSGLGCSRWPNCEPGEFIEIGDPNQAIEQLNRMFTGAVSIGVAAAVLGATRLRRRRRDLVWLSWGLVAGVVGQIVLGGITVLVDLHPVAVAGHFLLSMILVSTGTVLLWRSGIEDPPAGRVGERSGEGLVLPNPLPTLSWLMVATATSVLAVTGPLVTGSGPHAGDLDAPRFGLAISDAARIHSFSAWLFCAMVIAVGVTIARNTASAAPGGHRTATGRRTAASRQMRAVTVLLVVVIAQGAIGYLQYARGIPAGLVLGHIVGATCIAIATTWLQCEILWGHLRVGRGSAGDSGNDPHGGSRTATSREGASPHGVSSEGAARPAAAPPDPDRVAS